MTDFRLATWNIRKCIGLDRRRDPFRITQVLAEFKADIVALQEVDKRLGRRPAALPPEMLLRETGLIPVATESHDDSLGWHGNAVLLSAEFRAEAIHGMDLPGIEPRGALIVDVAGRGTHLRVVAVHLGLLGWARQAQLAAIRRRLDAMPPRPTVILGDFNEWSHRRTHPGLAGYEVHAPGPSYHSARPVAALDRVALGHGLSMRRSSVVATDLTRVASDHLPVRADIHLT